MSKIQNASVKSQSELISGGATKADLINDDKIYVTANSINKRLDEAITDGDIGGGGGGGLGDADTINLTLIQDIELADIDITGQDTKFAGGGTITVSSLSISTTAVDLLKGTSVSKYAPAANGQDDYFGFTQDIPLNYRGHLNAIQIGYKTDSTTIDNDFRLSIKLKDGANAGDIRYYNLPKYDADDTGNTFKETFFVPKDTTQIEYGIQNTSTTTTVEFYWDNILITADAFISKNLLDVQSYRIYQAGSALTNRTGELEFNLGTATIQNDGADLITIADDSGSTRTTFTANRDIPHFTISAEAAINTINYGMSIFINGSGIALGGIVHSAGPHEQVAWTGSLSEGDIVTVAMSNGSYSLTQSIQSSSERCAVWFTAFAEKEAIVHTSNGSLYQEVWHVANQSTMLAFTGPVRFALGNILTDGQDYLKIEDTGGFTRFTAKQPIEVNYSLNTQTQTAAGWHEMLKNGVIRKRGSQSTSSTGFQEISGSVHLDLGDYITFDCGLGTVRSIADPAYLQIMARPSPQVVITPTVQIAYIKDIKSAGTAGGTFTSGAWQTRTLNTVEGDSSFIALSSNQFSIGKGEYDFEAVAPGVLNSFHKVKLYDITNAVDEIIGTSENSDNTSGGHSQTMSFIKGRLSLTEQTTFELRHRCTVTRATDGFGRASNISVDEVYAMIKLTKLK